MRTCNNPVSALNLNSKSEDVNITGSLNSAHFIISFGLLRMPQGLTGKQRARLRCKVSRTGPCEVWTEAAGQIQWA